MYEGRDGWVMNVYILWSLIKEHVLHKFTKYASIARVNQIVNKDLNGESSYLSSLSEMDDTGNRR